MVAKPVLTRVWANAAGPGDIEDPDITLPGKFDTGWIAEIPTYQNFNFLQQLFTQGLAHANERGIMEWDVTTPYVAAFSYVTSPVNGLVYRATVSQAGNEPSVSPGQWAIFPATVNSATESVAGIVELATAAETIAGADSVRAVHPAGLAALQANDTTRGLVERATQTEVNTGSDTSRFITPATMNGKTANTTRRGVVELATNAESQAGVDAARAVTPASMASVTALTTRRGLVELATGSEVATGTDATRAITPSTLLSRTASTARTGLVELATSAETQTGSDGSRAVTPAGLSARTSTETRTGVIEIATLAEVATGVDGNRAVTPFTLQAELSGLSGNSIIAVANLVGTVFQQNLGFSGVSNPSVGRYIFTFSTPRASNNYSVLSTGSTNVGGSFAMEVIVVNKSNTTFEVQTWYTTGGSTRALQNRTALDVMVLEV